ncbi:hypothetical protein M885DRAFT_535214 [Pelagophyceae sp. CCMP2097]|nr:hypothetical protein M885DRAFT_535214 [Pelagophyceae sp. CCMP2097]
MGPQSALPLGAGSALRLVVALGGLRFSRSSVLCADDAAAFPQAMHAFYYLWYGDPETDGGWRHWDHDVLPHWDARVRKHFSHLDGAKHDPPHWLHSPFYPQLGPYSSTAENTLDAHFAQMAQAGIDAAVLSWTGRPGGAVSDTQGVSTDAAFPATLAAAKRHGVKVAVHLEPYPGRSPETVRGDVEYLAETYGDALLKLRRPGRCAEPPVPAVYVYDAYHSPSAEWAALLCDGAASVRGRSGDFFAVATVLEQRELQNIIVDGCFDGLYTYFATDGFTFGSSSGNWPFLAKWAGKHGKLFSPSVGPGYNDTRIRPWNAGATRHRRGGAYYDGMMDKALASRPDVVSITSFNEWGEGTQIEPARVPPGSNARTKTHLDYGADPNLYLRATRDAKKRWAAQTDQEL